VIRSSAIPPGFFAMPPRVLSTNIKHINQGQLPVIKPMDGPFDNRLPSELWIKAHIRRCGAEGVPVIVAHRGEKNTGTLLLKLNLLDRGCRVLTQTRDLKGDLAWLPALKGELVAESEADSYIERAVARDPDLWVVEIEHRDGWHPFEGEEL
jgi:hypothetical protein